jgi:hypothetical protein
MNVRCRDGALRGCDDHLIQTPNHIAGRIESGNGGLLMGIDSQGAVFITASTE